LLEEGSDSPDEHGRIAVNFPDNTVGAVNTAWIV